jgi:hypothetical protein
MLRWKTPVCCIYSRNLMSCGTLQEHREAKLALNLQDRFYALLERYNSGFEPLESWETKDLSELEQIVNAELQDRHYRTIESQGIAVLPGVIRRSDH